jgi:hypothetical protein
MPRAKGEVFQRKRPGAEPWPFSLKRRIFSTGFKTARCNVMGFLYD